MRALWAIAKKMLQESFRRRSPLLLGLFLVAIVFSFPFVLKSDGTLKGQVQLTVTYSVTLTFLALSLLTIFLGVSSFTGEIKYRQIYLIETKPVYRWQFLWGKFLGLAMLNLIFLSAMGLAIWILIQFTIVYFDCAADARISDLRLHRRIVSFLKYAVSSERKMREADLLTPYHVCRPYLDRESIAREVEEEYQRRRQERRLTGKVSEAEHKEDIRNEILQRQNSIQYLPFYKEQKRKPSKVWIFKDIPATLKQKPGAALKLRYKLYTSRTAPEGKCFVSWRDNRDKSIFQGIVNTGEFFEFRIPTAIIEDNDTVEIRFVHLDPHVGDVSFPFRGGVELYYSADSFEMNYLRGLFVFYMILCFLSLVALCASTFLTFPVAILVALYIMVLGLIANFLGSFVPMGTEILLHEERNIWYYICKKVLSYVFWLLPDFTTYISAENLAMGRMIEWMVLIKSALYLLFIRGILVLGGLGCVIFHYREIGKPLE